MKEVETNSIAFKYDVDALLNYKDEELGVFHVGYFEDPDIDYHHALEMLVKKVVMPLKENRCERVLDLGCGVGYPTRQAQGFLNVEITGIDFSAKSIELAKKTHALPSLHFSEMSAYDLQFDSETFDGVFAIESLFHMEKESALREVYRVLKKGGIFSISDYYAKMGWQGLIDEDFSSITDLEEMVELFKSVGFSKVETTDWTEVVLPSYQRLKKRKMVGEAQVEFEAFCDSAGKATGYVHLVAVK